MQIPHNLPLQLTSFVGRQRELAEVEALLYTHRLVTLTGAGGSGKTRLALAVAAAIAAGMPRSVPVIDQTPFLEAAWFVELASVSSPAAVSQALATALAVREQTGQPIFETVLASLRSKSALIILDNCEHLIDVCAQAAESLLRSCPGVRILATSRASLGVAGEFAWTTPPLAMPEQEASAGEQQEPAATWAAYDAIRLFTERAAAVQPAFALTEQNTAVVVQVCRTLDGMPLAIEMAAARVKVLTVEQIADLLAASVGARFRVLAAGNRKAVPRHRTLLAAIGWSYDLLDEQEQLLLRRLASFAGSFTLDAVEAIFPENTLDLLSRLVDKSLVIVEPPQHQMARYRLLETIRQFAYEKLLPTGELRRLQSEQLVFYCGLIEELEPKLRHHEQDLALERFTADYHNLRAALAWSLGDEDVDSVSRAYGVQLAGVLPWFWYLCTRYAEGRHWCERGLAICPSTELSARARVLLGAGIMAQMQADFSQAWKLLEASVALYRHLEDPRSLAFALLWLASAASVPGDQVAARGLLLEALDLARAVDDSWLIGCLEFNLGSVLLNLQDAAAAEQLFADSVARLQALGEMNGLADALVQQCGYALGRGDDDGVRSLAAQIFQALSTRRFLDDKYFRAAVLGCLGTVARHAGDNQQAHRLFADGLRVAQDMGNPWFAGIAHHQLGWLALVQGEVKQAMADFRLSLAAYIGMTPVDLVLALSGTLLAAADRQLWERAAVLDAAVAPMLAAITSPLHPVKKADLARATAAVRHLRDDPGLAVARARGQAMTLAEVVAYAVAPVPSYEPAQSAIPVEPQPELRLYALGPMRVYRGDHLIAAAEWTYAKSRELLFFLLCHPPRTKEQIGLVFWPDASPSQLRNSFNVAVYHLRHALGRPDWIVFDNGRYAFNRTLPAYCDLHVFEASLAQARACLATAPAEALHYLRQATACNQGDFLEDCTTGDWWLLRREQIRQQYLDALLTIGSLHFQTGDYARAADAYRQAIDRDSLLEEAHHGLIRAYAQLGKRSEALHHYDRLAQLMREELDLPPAEETTSLVAALRRGAEL